MIKHIFWTIVCMASAIFTVTGQTQETSTAASANDFLNSIGANSAIYRRGENVAKTIEICTYTGIRWIRTDESGLSDNGSTYRAEIKQLFDQAGVKVSLSLGSGGANIANLVKGAKFIAAYGGLVAIEGCNEPNNWGITYQGQKGGGSNSWAPVARLHRDLYTQVKADAVLKDYPVWTTTETGAETDNVGLQYLTVPTTDNNVTAEFRGATYADAANCHNYFIHPSWLPIQNNQNWLSSNPTSSAKGDHLYGNFGSTWANHFAGYPQAQLNTLPRVTTETGVTLTTQYQWVWADPNTQVYDTTKPNPDYTNPSKCVTEEVQGLMYMGCYLSQFKQGWSHTAIYILRDRTDENGNQSFGFYAGDYTARKAALYLHNLTTILSDNTPVDPSTLKNLSCTFSAYPATVHDLLLQKSNGKLYLIVWSERYLGGEDDITILFPTAFDEIKVYNPVVGTDPVQTSTSSTSVNLAMTNHPFILELTGSGDTGTTPTNTPQKAYIFPNPAGDCIQIANASGLKKAEIYDLSGKRLLAVSGVFPATKPIDIKALSPDTYILKLTGGDDAVESFKFIKQ